LNKQEKRVQCYLREDLKAFFSPQQPLFDQLMALQGEVFRHQDGRRTQRIQLGGKSYFIKQHEGVGWREIFKNLFQGRLPVISAKNEWQAIQKLSALGVPVAGLAGYGERGWNPARRQSFILMEDIAPSISLETLCQSWRQAPPSFKLKSRLIAQVAAIARLMHRHGMNHRDFYLCHFLTNPAQLASDPLKLYLIDLHRVQIRTKTPERWIIKDLAGLYFSCHDIGLSRHDLYRFMKHYRQRSLRDIFRTERTFWEKVNTRGNTYRDHTK
jgi:heptose I phosphotransferase